MKINEIQLVVPQDEKLYKSYVTHIKNERELGKSEGFDVYEGTMDSQPTFIARTLEGTFLSYVIGNYVEVLGKKYFQTKHTYSDFKGKGYTTALYIFIAKKLNIPLISDGEQSPLGKALWVSIGKKGHCKVYDSVDEKIVDVDDVPKNTLYSVDAEKGKRYHLVIEQFSSLRRGGPLSKILHENTIYTDPQRKYL